MGRAIYEKQPRECLIAKCLDGIVGSKNNLHKGKRGPVKVPYQGILFLDLHCHLI